MSEYLYLICEMAAAFAGFTAIVSVLDSRSTESRTLDIARLRGMLEVSLFTIAGGLFPTLLTTVGLDGDTLWRTAGSVMMLGGFLLLRVQYRRAFSERIQAQPGYNLAYARFITVLGVIALGCFVASVIGAFRPDGLYAVALTLTFLIAGLQFLRTASSVLGA